MRSRISPRTLPKTFSHSPHRKSEGTRAKAGDGLTVVQTSSGKGTNITERRTRELRKRWRTCPEERNVTFMTIDQTWPEPAFKVLDVDDEIEPLASVLTSL
jgi:hypothetical protein